MLAKDGAEPYDAPNPDNIKQFHQVLSKQYQIPCTVRLTMGQDIDGACGQLALEKGVKKGQRDIEDMVPRRKSGAARRGKGGEEAAGGQAKAKEGCCDMRTQRVVAWPERARARVDVALEAVRVSVALSGPAAIACSLLLGQLRACR
jgi:hypothetical protein